MLSSGATYCNFFTLHWNRKYKIDIRISEPEKSSEQVTFYQQEMELPG